MSDIARDQPKVEARLNLEHLEKLYQATGLPLVLHGGSGIKRDNVLAAIQRGIAKVNIGTEIRQAYEQAGVPPAASPGRRMPVTSAPVGSSATTLV